MRQRITYPVTHVVRFIVVLAIGFAVAATSSSRADECPSVPHVVFVTGDEEYRSEESMPMLAQILQRDYGFRTTVCFSLDSDGFIDPNNTKSISGLEELAEADLMVLFTRFRDLPPEQMEHFLAYVETGKPIVGFRTATHAFKFPADSPYREWNLEKIAELVGQHWITHHGHHGDDPLTAVSLIEDQRQHPVLRGVEPFECYSWLYHVDGGKHSLRGDSQPLLMGRTLKSSHEDNPDYPPTTPVAWTKTYQAASGQSGRVFFTTLGHPYDFKHPSMRRLGLQGILWALGREDDIPYEGVSVDTVGEFDPNNAGFGRQFKQGVTPAERTLGRTQPQATSTFRSVTRREARRNRRRARSTRRARFVD
ncbi:MAG: ThuA domain-containing protein [Planctomycetota bacterium]|nr:MAG: ThuA domain-containing protein [Planctomycetota bacterium]REJ92732.1 MAG: ThuA domain-containing protein [Planctomycetota bacterium]REK23770.1 MAG: ThuA domain-containing protein [Planctomycetota bacterium]REK47623.1 MAG: ThuA domain-containing protein [Planctomycetota bacterium]